MRTDQADLKVPMSMNGKSWTVKSCIPPQVCWMKVHQPSAHDRNRRPVVTACDGMLPMRRPKKPAMAAPTMGASTQTVTTEDMEDSTSYPFIMLASSTAISPRLRKKVTRMARPTAASAAATVSTNMAMIWPWTLCR